MNRLLPFFLLLSASTHGLALALLGGSPAVAPLAGHNLRVTLLAGPSQSSRSIENGATEATSNGGRSADSRPEIAERKVLANGALNKPSEASNTSNPGVKVPELKAATPTHGTRLVTELNKLLTATFTYPPIARKLGQQGRVVVTVNLGGQGQIERTELFESSGYRALDQAALRSIRDIRHAPQLIKWLNGQPASIRVPVIYRLAEA